MTRQTPESSWIRRLWTPVIQASRAAVSAHYSAPWQRRASR